MPRQWYIRRRPRAVGAGARRRAGEAFGGARPREPEQLVALVGCRIASGTSEGLLGRLGLASALPAGCRPQRRSHRPLDGLGGFLLRERPDSKDGIATQPRDPDFAQLVLRIA